MSHLVERMKELKRRRKRRQEALKVKNRKAASLRAALPIQRKSAKELETFAPIPSKPVVKIDVREKNSDAQIIIEPEVMPTKPIKNLQQTAWKEAQSITELVKLLPNDVKTKKLWRYIPEQLREEIIKEARCMAESRNFAAPAEWDGSLKQALLLMENGRLPNGFKNFLGF
jgi:cell division septum initiation protein DivIVA